MSDERLKMFGFLLLLLVSTVYRWQHNEDQMGSTDELNYGIFKYDPLNYDEAMHRMIQQYKMEELHKQEAESEELKKAELPRCNSDPVFKRYLRKMLEEAERFGLPKDSGSKIFYNAEMTLTKHMVSEIRRFVDGEDCNMGVLDDAVIRSLVTFNDHTVRYTWSSAFEDLVGMDLCTACQILLVLTCVVIITATQYWSRVSWFMQLTRLYVLGFTVSVFWNWAYLYKAACAEQITALTKLEQYQDGSCGKNMGWLQSLADWWQGAATFRNDPCQEYYKALQVHPIFQVPPTKALALTVSDFITEPLVHLGKATGAFLNGLLAEIPWLYQLPILILVAIMLMVFLYGVSKVCVQVIAQRTIRGAPQERRPMAAPPAPQEEGPQKIKISEEHFIQMYRYLQEHRPEYLETLNMSRPTMHVPSITDVGSTVNDNDVEQELRDN